MATPLNFGILGCARIARRGMIAGIQQTAEARLWSIASRQNATAEAWSVEFGIPRFFASYEELLADPELDAVYIPLPNELHLEWCLKAAAAGKHVLCEKPLALDVAQAEQMAAACRRHGVLLMEAFMWRHHPRVARVRQMLAAGELGELRLVKMDFSFEIDRADWRLNPQRGGGPLFDLGCYGINAARLFTQSEPVEIHARARRGSSGCDMTTAIMLTFPTGVQALLDCSFECPYRNRLEIVGTQGAVELPEGVLPPEESELIVRDAAGVRSVRFAAAQQYAEQVRAFCSGIRGGQLPAPAEDGVANMRVLDAVLRQLQ